METPNTNRGPLGLPIGTTPTQGTMRGPIDTQAGNLLQRQVVDEERGIYWIAIDTDGDGRADVWGNVFVAALDHRIATGSLTQVPVDAPGADAEAPLPILPRDQLDGLQGTLTKVTTLTDKRIPAEGDPRAHYRIYVDTNNDGEADVVVDRVPGADLDAAIAGGRLTRDVDRYRPPGSPAGTHDPVLTPVALEALVGDASARKTVINPQAVKNFAMELRLLQHSLSDIDAQLQSVDVQGGDFRNAVSLRSQFYPTNIGASTTEQVRDAAEKVRLNLGTLADKLDDARAAWWQAKQDTEGKVDTLDTFITEEFGSAGSPAAGVAGTTGAAGGAGAAAGAATGAGAANYPV